MVFNGQNWRRKTTLAGSNSDTAHGEMRCVRAATQPMPPVAGELLFRSTTGECNIILEHLAGAPLMFILSMSLISKGFEPDCIFDRDKCEKCERSCRSKLQADSSNKSVFISVPSRSTTRGGSRPVGTDTMPTLAPGCPRAGLGALLAFTLLSCMGEVQLAFVKARPRLR